MEINSWTIMLAIGIALLLLIYHRRQVNKLKRDIRRLEYKYNDTLTNCNYHEGKSYLYAQDLANALNDLSVIKKAHRVCDVSLGYKCPDETLCCKHKLPNNNKNNS